MRYFLAIFACFLALVTAPASFAQEESAAAPREVTVGMYINDIQAIDLRTHSYGMDFYLWFRWVGDDINPAEGFEFMNTFDPEAHVETVLYDTPQPQPDGSLYQIVRHQGLFTTKFPIRNYPFDHQDLHIAVEDAEEGAESLVYIADDNPLVLNPRIRLPGYSVGKPHVDIYDNPYATAFGDLSEPDVTAYSRADFVIPIIRPALSGVLKAIFPILIIISAAVFALLLDPDHVEARIGLAITSLLTLVAMQFTMQSSLPDVAYLTLLDQVFLLSYLYIVVVIGLVVRGTRVDDKGALRGDGVFDQAWLVSGGKLAGVVSLTYLLMLVLIVLLNQ